MLMKWNPWRLLTVVGIIAVVAVAGPVVPVKTTRSWCCPVSGSTKHVVRWFGLVSREFRETSALETWLKKREPSFEPQFQFTSVKKNHLIGTLYGSSPAPPIYGCRGVLALVVERLTEERIVTLVKVLRTGTPEDQRHALAAAVDEATDAESNAR